MLLCGMLPLIQTQNLPVAADVCGLMLRTAGPAGCRLNTQQSV
jgi:hypothetical protein